MENTETTFNGHTAAAHFVLQGKGGVGKSYVSAVLAQYFRRKEKPLHCIDTDPVNATFAQYKRLGAEHLNILRRGTVHEKSFDELVDQICGRPGVFVIDTGATTFVPLWNYILENKILEFLKERGRPVFVHTIVAGGQARSDTLNGLKRLAETTAEKNIVVWLNEYFGELATDGNMFIELNIDDEQALKVLGFVLIRERNPQTYGDDVRQMMQRRLTFEEAIQRPEFSLVSKQRLTIISREIFEQIDALAVG
jgi:hypothetical protein